MAARKGEFTVPLFGKKTPDDEWRAAVVPIADTISRTCEAFGEAGQHVAADPIVGWVLAEAILVELPAYEAAVNAAHRDYKSAGKPQGDDPIVSETKNLLDRFFEHAGLAFHWGKYHYKDASGGPGERARYETGFAQRAAITRISNNGTQFAENALLAARVGRAAVQSLTTETYSSGGPTLISLFLEAAQSGLVEELRRSKQIPLSQLAMLGGWCYSRAAILGMLVASHPVPFVALVWDLSRAEKFWEFTKDEIDRIDAADISQSAGLGYVRMQTGYSELHGQEAMSLVRTGDMKAIEELASSKRSLNEVTSRLAMDIAAGLGVGLQRPDFVRERLEAEANPDRAEWAMFHDAGLDIPSEPDAISADEQIGIVVELCRLFFEEFYPDAYEAFKPLASQFPSTESE